MENLEGTKEYWQKDLEKGGNHYHNKWQDAYAFGVRTNSFRSEDFKRLKKVVDVGCGIGEYMQALSEKAPETNFLGFDFPFNIEQARQRYAGNPRLEFRGRSLPDPEVEHEIGQADGVVITTVYVHLASEAREAFLRALGRMHPGSRVMFLEYAPDTVPEFQKNLPHKVVETPAEISAKLEQQGFKKIEIRAVNYLDSFLFFHLGKNALSYYLTLGIEKILSWIHYQSSKYKLFIFEKI
jgi:2-polyprenyl-3-methyl-5-hydroxy-6-metoxy-1,4-benzoquinol methylase